MCCVKSRLLWRFVLKNYGGLVKRARLGGGITLMVSPLKAFVFVLSITLIAGGPNSLTLSMASFYFAHSANFCYSARYKSFFTTRYDLNSAQLLKRLWAVLSCAVCVFGYAWAIDYSQLIIGWAEPMPFWTEPFLLVILFGLYLLGLVFDIKCKYKASYALLFWLFDVCSLKRGQKNE